MLPFLLRCGPLRLWFSVALVAVVLATGMLLVPQFAPRTFAAQLAVTCHTQPNQKNCDQQDPKQQQCVDATVTTVSVPLLDANNQPVGRLERRHSVLCQTWWARIFDDRPIPGPKLFLSLGTRSELLLFKGMAYSDMTFDASNTHAPLIVGSLATPQGTLDPMLTATIPSS